MKVWAYQLALKACRAQGYGFNGQSSQHSRVVLAVTQQVTMFWAETVKQADRMTMPRLAEIQQLCGKLYAGVRFFRT